jgi:hypothetical protein
MESGAATEKKNEENADWNAFVEFTPRILKLPKKEVERERRKYRVKEQNKSQDNPKN